MDSSDPFKSKEPSIKIEGSLLCTTSFSPLPARVRNAVRAVFIELVGSKLARI